MELTLMSSAVHGSCVVVGAERPRRMLVAMVIERTNIMSRQCLACGVHPAITTPEWPALCAACLNRAGDDIRAEAQVVCTVDHGCSGIVDRLVDDDQLVVVRTHDGKEAWVPIQEMVRVTG